MEHKHHQIVPLGVKIISIVYMAASALMAIAGSVVMSGSNGIGGLLSNFAQTFSKLALASTAFKASIGGFMLLIGIAGIALGIYLWRLKKWARITAMVFAGIGVLLSIKSIITFDWLALPWSILNILIFVYLFWSKKVKEAFK